MQQRFWFAPAVVGVLLPLGDLNNARVGDIADQIDPREVRVGLNHALDALALADLAAAARQCFVHVAGRWDPIRRPWHRDGSIRDLPSPSPPR